MNKIIFFMNCRVNDKYDSLLRLYLEDFKASGIEKRNDIKLIFCVVGKETDYARVMTHIKDHLPRLLPNHDGKNILTVGGEQRFELRMFHNSRYEHVGIEAAWKEAMASEDDELITYCHCRGLGHKHPKSPEMNGSREIFSSIPSTHIIRHYKNVEEKFEENPDITRVGVAQSPLGWMWFNFWTCKASYLKTRPKPDVNGVPSTLVKKYFDRWVQDRHYYEAWLGDDGQTLDQGYSMCIRPHKGVMVSGPQIIGALRMIAVKHINNNK